MKFEPIVGFILPKKFNGLNFVFGAHRIQKIISNVSHFLANISRLMMIQRLRFGFMAVLDLVSISNGLDLNLLSRVFLKKIKNRTRLYGCPKYCSFTILYPFTLNGGYGLKMLRLYLLHWVEAGNKCQTLLF